MSLNNFIPEVWATSLLRNLHKAEIFAQPNVCNRDYEGEIQEKGDTVRINAIGSVTVSDYTKDTDIAAPQALTDAQTTLVVEKMKYFNFAVDDVDQFQQQPKMMGEAMYEAGYALADVQDQYVAGLYTDVSASNMIGSDAAPKAISAVTDIYNFLVDLKVKLDESNVPPDRRWVIVPPWFEGYMLKDDRFVRNFNLEIANSALLNGQVAKAAGFAVLNSNNVTFSGLASTGNYRVMAGHPMAITFAEQINKVEAYRPPYRFSDAVKGLNLYGAKVARPQALALLTITRS